MGTGYTRNDTPNNIADGNVINASDLDGEFDAIQSAFNGSTGHSHDGTTGEGPQIATAGLADNAVTTAKITDANVTLAKMATNSVDSDQYVDGSIDRVHLAADIVDGTKIADDSIDSEHYVDGSIDTAHIADDAVTSAKLDTNIQIAGTLGVTGETTLTTHLNMGDNDIIKLGDSADLQIYHDGSDSYIKEDGTGNLIVAADDFRVTNVAVTETMIAADTDSYVRLYYDNGIKLETKTDGVDITGELQSDSLDVDGNADISGNLVMSGGGNVDLTDNAQLRLGASQDLLIYHDGANSRIDDAGSGRLIIRGNGGVSLEKYTGETLAIFNSDGASSLYYDNSPKLETTSSGIDVTGTATMDGLTVDGDATIQNTGDSYRTFTIGANRSASVNTLGRLDYDWDGTPVARIHAISGTDATNKDNGDLVLSTSEDGTLKQRIFIDQSGDISFYEDTGTTPKLFWDASAESLGIGTSTVNEKLVLLESLGDTTLVIDNARSNVGDTGRIEFRHNSITGSQIKSEAIEDFSVNANRTSDLQFWTRNNGTISERMRITSDGNVGIGTDIPAHLLHLSAADPRIQITDTSTNVDHIINANSSVGNLTIDVDANVEGSSPNLIIDVAGTEAMRIDDNQNLLVGTTDSSVWDSNANSTADNGGNIRNDGRAGFSYYNASGTGATLNINRTGTNGSIAQFRRIGVTVGDIGTNGNLYIQGPTSSSGVEFANNAVRPFRDGARDDGNIDLGVDSTGRFKDLYLSGGIQFDSRSNKLDDYEEGTFTPVVADATSGGNTASLLAEYGFYTKIGRQVTVYLSLADIDTTGMTGTNILYIRDIPFVANNTTGRNVTGAVRVDKVNVDPACIGVVALMSAGTTQIQIYQNRDATTDIAVLVNTLNSGTADIFVTLTYDTT